MTSVEFSCVTTRQRPKFHLPPDNPARKLRPVAELITSNPPFWLSEHLSEWVGRTYAYRADEEGWPTRGEMKKLLVNSYTWASSLRQALDNPLVCGFLSAGGNGAMDDPRLFQKMLDDLRWRAAGAVKSPALVGKNGKLKPGRSRVRNDGAMSGRTYCALLVAEAWKWFHKRYPSPRNMKAAEAAELCWRLTGGEESKGWGSNRRTLWRHYFEEAASIAGEPDRTEIWRRMGAAAHFLRNLLIQISPAKPAINPAQ